MPEKQEKDIDIFGVWKYVQNAEEMRFEIFPVNGVPVFRQNLEQFGQIEGQLRKAEDWYQVQAPHGTLRVKPKGKHKLISQFKKSTAYVWGKPIISRPTHALIVGLWHQADNTDNIGKRLCKIDDKKIHWFTGQSLAYSWMNHKTIYIRVDGVRYVGNILLDEIQWSDGDCWKKKPKKNTTKVHIDRSKYKKSRKKKRNLEKEDVGGGELEIETNDEEDNDYEEEEESTFELMEVGVSQNPEPTELEEETGDADLEEEDAMYGLDEEDEDAEKENTRRMAPGTDLGDDDVNRLLKTAFTNKQRNTFLQQVVSSDLTVSRKSKKKKKSSQTTGQKIIWDEDNLQLNEDERIERMIIDEPKTPYNQMEDEEILLANDIQLTLPFGDFGDESSPRINPQLNDPEFLEQMANEALQRQNEPILTATDEFMEKRKSHYNEGRVWKTGRELIQSGAEVLDIHE